MTKLPISIKTFFVSTIIYLLLVGVAGVNPASAQTATDSGTSTESATTTTTSDATATDSSKGGLPAELPESGSSDLTFGLGIGLFLIISGLVGRVTLAGLLKD